MIDIKYKERFDTIPTSAEKLDGNAFKTLAVMIRLWKEYAYKEGEHKGWFFHSWKDLKEETGLSNDALNRCISLLVEEKYICREYDNWRDNKSNWYQLNEIYWELDKQPKPIPYTVFEPVQILEEANM